jgi:hypothetical protein
MCKVKRALKRFTRDVYHFVDGVRVEGAPDAVWGDISYVSGDLTGVSGYLIGVSGNLTGVSGDLTGVSGNIDACGLTDEDRRRGVDIEDLIGGAE